MPAPDAGAARAWGVVAGCLVLALAFPWVNSEWKGGWLQAIGGASLIAVPAGLIVWGIRTADTSTGARIVLRSLLIVAVLLSLAGIYSYGVYTAPLCLAPLWIAAWRAGPKERFFWVLLAVPSWHITGWLIRSSFDHPIDNLPTLVTLGGAALTWVTPLVKSTESST